MVLAAPPPPRLLTPYQARRRVRPDFTPSHRRRIATQVRHVQAARRHGFANALRQFFDLQAQRIIHTYLLTVGLSAHSEGLRAILPWQIKADVTADELFPHSELQSLQTVILPQVTQLYQDFSQLYADLAGLTPEETVAAVDAAAAYTLTQPKLEAQQQTELAQQEGHDWAVDVLGPHDPGFEQYLSAAGQRIVGIDDTTRQAVQDTLTYGASQNYTPYEIAHGVPKDGFDGLIAVVQQTYHGRADTIARTETAIAAQSAAVARYKDADVGFVYVDDGDGCGWTSHDDPDEADGTIRSIDDAEDYPVSHPNCVRVFTPVLTGVPHGPAEVAQPEPPVPPPSPAMAPTTPNAPSAFQAGLQAGLEIGPPYPHVTVKEAEEASTEAFYKGGKGEFGNASYAAEKVANRLVNSPDFVKYAQSRSGYTDPLEASKSQAHEFINNWAGTSADSDELAIALQVAVEDTLGLQNAVTSHFPYSTRSAADQLYQQNKAAFQAFVQAMYDQTQQELADQGVDHLVLFRGMGLSDIDKAKAIGLIPQDATEVKREVRTVDTQQQPISSWSYSSDVAEGFAHGHVSAVVAASVPASKIFSSFKSGFGTTYEREVVVLGGGTTTVNVSTWSRYDGQSPLTAADVIKGPLTKKPRKPRAPKTKDIGDPMLNLDGDQDNADWLRGGRWSIHTPGGKLAATVAELREALGPKTDEQLKHMLDTPVARAMPSRLRDEIEAL